MNLPVSLVLAIALCGTEGNELASPEVGHVRASVVKVCAEVLRVDASDIRGTAVLKSIGANEDDVLMIAEEASALLDIFSPEVDDWDTLTVDALVKRCEEAVVEVAQMRGFGAIGKKLLDQVVKKPGDMSMDRSQLRAAACLTAAEKGFLKDHRVARIECEEQRQWAGVYRITVTYSRGQFSFTAYKGDPPAAEPVDSSIADETLASKDLNGDKTLMWKTHPLGRGEEKCSPREAVWAASRVFNTVKLEGKTKAEVIAILGDPKKSSDSTYNFPFWPPKGSLVYRFDTGSYGWQFDVELGKDGKVVKVHRRWIH